ncbi:50S ribosomal protein L9 [Candidatus Omnitrophota bacterium]
MKVVFLDDVPKIARAGEIKEVSNGYGRNFLIPKKLAVLANPSVTNMAEIHRRIKSRDEAEERGRMTDLAQQLDEVEITLKARSGLKGRLYGSITAVDIVQELESTTGLVVDKKKVQLSKAIHQLGRYKIAIKLAKNIIPNISVTVTEEIQ